MAWPKVGEESTVSSGGAARLGFVAVRVDASTLRPAVLATIIDSIQVNPLFFSLLLISFVKVGPPRLGRIWNKRHNSGLILCLTLVPLCVYYLSCEGGGCAGVGAAACRHVARPRRACHWTVSGKHVVSSLTLFFCPPTAYRLPLFAIRLPKDLIEPSILTSLQSSGASPCLSSPLSPTPSLTCLAPLPCPASLRAPRCSWSICA